MTVVDCSQACDLAIPGTVIIMTDILIIILNILRQNIKISDIKESLSIITMRHLLVRKNMKFYTMQAFRASIKDILTNRERSLVDGGYQDEICVTQQSLNLNAFQSHRVP